jgi:hypothetical protein
MGEARNTRENMTEKYYLEDWGEDMDNIKIDLKPMRWKGVDWINLTHNIPQWRAVVNAILNLARAIKGRKFFG